MIESSNHRSSRTAATAPSTTASQRFRHLGLLAATFLAVAGGAPALRAQSADKPAVLLHIAQGKDNREDYRTYRNTQAVLVTTRTVVSAALKKLGIADLALVKRQKDPVAWLRSNLRVDFPRDSEVLRISLRRGDPREAALLVNAVADSYLDQFVLKERRQMDGKLEALKESASRHENLLRAKRRQLKQQGETTNSREALALERQVALEDLAAARKGLAQVRSELRKVKVELGTQRETDNKSTDPVYSAGLVGLMGSPLGQGPFRVVSLVVLGSPARNPAVEALIDRDSVVQPLRERAVVLEDKIKQMRSVSSSKEAADRNAKRYVDELQLVRERIEARRHELRPALAKEMRAADLERDRARTVMLQKQLAHFRKLEEALRSDVARLDKATSQAMRGTVDADSLREEIARTEAIVKKIAAQVASVETESTIPPRITLLEKAEAPQVK